jgi:nitrous oxidase accessory protein NosD
MTYRRASVTLALAFTLLLAVMAGHESEHVAQIVQKDAIGASCPNDCRGLLGFVFDLEWVHFLYNTSIELVLVGLILGFRLWREPLLVSAAAIQGYHVVEHSEKLAQWFANGRHSPTPGILGHHFSLVELHFVLNSVVFLLVLGGYLSLGLHRRLWELRTPPRLAVAAGLLAVAMTASAWGFEQRPQTIRLTAGVHQGPIVLDRPVRLVGEPGAVVRGGILVTGDDVVVRDLAVEGGDYGIEVREADSVLLQRIAISGARLDGINAQRSGVMIKNCSVRSSGDLAQGIEISFSLHGRPSLVQGCKITGGREGIVTHLAAVRIRKNEIRDTSLRAITMGEMSMGKIDENRVLGALGIGIFCGDYSHCAIERNHVAGTRPDMASGNPTRAGYGIVAHFYAWAKVRRNANADGIAAFVGADVTG